MILAKGFRPFFLLASAFAVVVVPAWALALMGALRVGGRFDPVSWHAHEMVFGFATAVLAGFLLTAVGNWTQRETAAGGPLASLAVVWIAGRVAMASSALLPAWLVAGIDVAFLPSVAIAVTRPIVAAGSRRNYVVVALLLAMSAADLAAHAGAGRRATLFAVDLVTLFMVLVTGRIVPMFTRNATRDASIRSIGKLDVAAMAAVAAVAVADLSASTPAIAATCATSALLVAGRSVHWGARRSVRDPLLWILHGGHAWIAIGLALRALAALRPSVPASAGVHALTAGAIGALTLGMMTRVALGHTGRPMVASPRMALAFVLVTVAALVRVGAPIVVPSMYLPALVATAALWTIAFAIYFVAFAPILARARVDGRPG